MKIPLYSQDGTKTSDIAVPETVFGVKANKGLIHRIVVRQLANKRHPIAHTLTKGEVRGGGKKPYRQKGTGRARQGSITNPHFRGGGVAFGPRNTRNFKTRATKKERRLVLLGILSEKFRDGRVSALESYSVDAPKTKTFVTMLEKLPFKGKILFVLPAKDEKFVRSSRNIQRVKSILVNYVNPADLLTAADVVFLKESIPQLEKLFVTSK